MAELHASSFAPPQAWSAELIASLLTQPTVNAFALLCATTPTAFLIARFVAGEGEILTLSVLPQWRCQGHASQLLCHLFAAARTQPTPITSLFIEVAVNNAPARALYAKQGFTPIGLRPNYYQQQVQGVISWVDAALLVKKLG